ncbi:MATE family efflux transporter [Archangium violaceum]|uniref:MATE family efflux transporter n=1 Tax=Archangium violaceum TaxID=83451 RepID=UPI002B2DF8E1|nr:MATE family efflux transporter [Archangium violaceum]
MHSAPGERVAVTIASLLRLAWPIIISRSTQVVVGLADAVMVAHLGESALASATTGAMNSNLVFILPMGTVFIVSSFASQSFGAGDLGGARRYAFYGLAIAGLAQVLCMALLPVLPAGLSLFEYTPEVRDGVRTYLQVRLLSGGLVVGFEALANYYAGLGNTRLPMVASLAAMGLNILGNWLLIDGHFGLPALGVAGAAWASVISTGISFVGLLAVFLVQGGSARWPRLHGREFLRTLRFGFPSGLNWFFEFLAYSFFVNVVVAGLGTTVLAALMAVMQLNSMAFMPAFAIGSAGAIVVGQAIGASARDEVPRAVRLTFVLTGCWQGLVGLVFLLAPRWAFMPFTGGVSEGELLDTGARMLRLSVAWQLFDAMVTTLAEALRAAGDTTFTLWMRMALAWFLFVPGAWVSVRVLGGGEVAAMLWLTVYIGGLALALYLRFRGGAWRRFNLLEQDFPPGVRTKVPPDPSSRDPK